MSNLEITRRGNSEAAAIQFAFEQLVKGIYTAMPGEIVAYDPATQRATVRPLIQVLDTIGLAHTRPEIADVPVWFPSGGGFTMFVPLAEGDPVLLLFSMRGLTAWKEDGGVSAPDEGVLFSANDAIALPGFVRPNAAAPAIDGGAVIQVEDGDEYIALWNSGDVEMRARNVSVVAAGTAVLQGAGGSVRIDASGLTHTGYTGGDHSH